jgi:hypothetical protein
MISLKTSTPVVTPIARISDSFTIAWRMSPSHSAVASTVPSRGP